MKINFYNSLSKCGYADLSFYPTRKCKNHYFFRTAFRTCRYSGVSVLCKKHLPFFWAQRFLVDYSFFSDSFHVFISFSVLLIHKIFWKLFTICDTLRLPVVCMYGHHRGVNIAYYQAFVNYTNVCASYVEIVC